MAEVFTCEEITKKIDKLKEYLDNELLYFGGSQSIDDMQVSVNNGKNRLTPNAIIAMINYWIDMYNKQGCGGLDPMSNLPSIAKPLEQQAGVLNRTKGVTIVES